jgi:hypothetical protein
MNVHTFGQTIPYNPDNLPEMNASVGPGTERPVGFVNLDLISRLYWSVKTFKISIAAIPLFDFTFEAFLLGGGSTGTIIGSTAGIATAAATDPIPIFLTGRTNLLHIFSKKVRLVRDGVYKNMTQEQFFASINEDKSKNALDIDPEESLEQNYLVSRFYNFNEGILVSPGNYHTLITRQGVIFINFSDIVYARRQYWPKIMIFMGNPAGGASFRSAITIRDPLFSASLNNLDNVSAFLKAGIGIRYNVPIVGGASFLGGFIPLFGSISTLGSNTYSVFGSIEIGNRCCDRFYFDGAVNTERECYKEEDCKDIYRQKTERLDEKI